MHYCNSCVQIFWRLTHQSIATIISQIELWICIEPRSFLPLFSMVIDPVLCMIQFCKKNVASVFIFGSNLMIKISCLLGTFFYLFGRSFLSCQLSILNCSLTWSNDYTKFHLFLDQSEFFDVKATATNILTFWTQSRINRAHCYSRIF